MTKIERRILRKAGETWILRNLLISARGIKSVNSFLRKHIKNRISNRSAAAKYVYFSFKGSYYNFFEKMKILTAYTKTLVHKKSLRVHISYIAQMKDDEICFRKKKKKWGGWGSEQGQISLWSFGTWNFGFFLFFGGYGGQNFIFLPIWTAKSLNLYGHDPLDHKNPKITTKYYIRGGFCLWRFGRLYSFIKQWFNSYSLNWVSTVFN